MGWKEFFYGLIRKNWLIGAIIGAIFGLLFWIVPLPWIFGYLGLLPCGLIFGFSGDSGLACIVYPIGIILNITFYFLVGAFIGLIYGKIKSKLLIGSGIVITILGIVNIVLIIRIIPYDYGIYILVLTPFIILIGLILILIGIAKWKSENKIKKPN